jgi:hypothetical protein
MSSMSARPRCTPRPSPRKHPIPAADAKAPRTAHAHIRGPLSEPRGPPPAAHGGSSGTAASGLRGARRDVDTPTSARRFARPGDRPNASRRRRRPARAEGSAGTGPGRNTSHSHSTSARPRHDESEATPGDPAAPEASESNARQWRTMRAYCPHTCTDRAFHHEPTPPSRSLEPCLDIESAPRTAHGGATSLICGEDPELLIDVNPGSTENGSRRGG